MKNLETNKLSHVPRGTFATLDEFTNLLLKWNKKMNLISKNSASFVWNKHVMPSAQLIRYIKRDYPLVLDVGSGAGFPGIVLAILKGWTVVLVEKNKKKCAFLNEAHRLFNLNLVIKNQAIEDATFFVPDIITSRGVTTVRNFLKITSKFLSYRVKVMLIKGDRCQVEIDESLGKEWYFDYEIKHSNPKGLGTIAILSDFKKV